MNSTYVALGDSITDSSNSYATKRYMDYLNEYYSFDEFLNLGVSGSTIGNLYDPFQSRLDELQVSPKLLTIYGGVNDFGRDQPLGKYGDSNNQTFYGALYQLFQSVNRLNPENVLFISHAKIGNDFFEEVNSFGLHQIDYEKAIHKMTCGFHINHLSLYDKIDFGGNDSSLSDDSLHPNDKGQRFIYGEILNYLNVVMQFKNGVVENERKN
ncbi:SGNH/GDSL hydrolase family protein [Companilactobacillus metriopterae]|uniref:SGNH/GDSL hydrolase family protein n=1 Tax=Companilactobacillus metriopterae TaxID=1909267 RepID=UPI00100AAB3E|nr:SGNH/GDSL hydrolase family protein [Companilactobacillus metriopterae]